MKIFVTGANGQLGYDVMRELAKRQASFDVRNVPGIDVSCENKSTEEIVVIGSDVQGDSLYAIRHTLYAKEQCNTEQCKVRNAECRVHNVKCIRLFVVKCG